MVNKRHKVRRPTEVRRREILDAATKLFSERGYNGITLTDVAKEVGISQPGLMHYVDSKESLLSFVITEVYDKTGTPEEFLNSGLPGSDPERPLFPSYMRYLICCNSRRPTLVQLYNVLGAEAVNPEHPLHDMFTNRPASIWEHYSEIPWSIPPAIGPWDNMRPYVRHCMELFDGIQFRWLRNPPIDMYAEWLDLEGMLFPSPLWDGYVSR